MDGRVRIAAHIGRSGACRSRDARSDPVARSGNSPRAASVAHEEHGGRVGVLLKVGLPPRRPRRRRRRRRRAAAIPCASRFRRISSSSTIAVSRRSSHTKSAEVEQASRATTARARRRLGGGDAPSVPPARRDGTRRRVRVALPPPPPGAGPRRARRANATIDRVGRQPHAEGAAGGLAERVDRLGPDAVRVVDAERPTARPNDAPRSRRKRQQRPLRGHRAARRRVARQIRPGR